MNNSLLFKMDQVFESGNWISISEHGKGLKLFSKILCVVVFFQGSGSDLNHSEC